MPQPSKFIIYRFLIYVNDEMVKEINGLNNDLPPDTSNGGLFIGGLPYHIREKVERSGAAGSVNGLIGTVSDIAFMDDM